MPTGFATRSKPPSPGPTAPCGGCATVWMSSRRRRDHARPRRARSADRQHGRHGDVHGAAPRGRRRASSSGAGTDAARPRSRRVPGPTIRCGRGVGRLEVVPLRPAKGVQLGGGTAPRGIPEAPKKPPRPCPLGPLRSSRRATGRSRQSRRSTGVWRGTLPSGPGRRVGANPACPPGPRHVWARVGPRVGPGLPRRAEAIGASAPPCAAVSPSEDCAGPVDA